MIFLNDYVLSRGYIYDQGMTYICVWAHTCTCTCVFNSITGEKIAKKKFLNTKIIVGIIKCIIAYDRGMFWKYIIQYYV